MRKADVEVCGMQVNININAFHELVINLDLWMNIRENLPEF